MSAASKRSQWSSGCQTIEAVDDGRQIHGAGWDLELCDAGEPSMLIGVPLV